MTEQAKAHGERRGERQPEVLSFPADLTTPVRAFLALAAPGEDAFLLESVAGGESQARYSFLGFGTAEVFEAGERARVNRNGEARECAGLPLEALAAWAGQLPRTPAALGIPFVGGAVGCMDFSSFALAESVLAPFMVRAREPRIRFGVFKTGLVLDHLKQEGCLYALPEEGENASSCRERLVALRVRLEAASPAVPREGAWVPGGCPDRERFARNFAAVQRAILDGECYQVVLSEPFEGRYAGDPFSVYRRLRRSNPSPYHFYVSLGGRQAVGASPEMLLQVQGRRVSTVPIAGTRRRGQTPAEDAALEAELRRDPKELAEHAMLVDLARNDLGRVCEYGSVAVPVRCAVERYSHVMHLVSEVQGRLAPERTALDALASAFPAGTVSGAPKIRAAQVLSGLEGQDRGLYGGAVGILAPDGNLEVCIAIRTLEFEAGRVRFRAGAGIVADSREQAEWDEIHHKAGVLLAALEGRSDGISPPPLVPSSPHPELRRTALEGEEP
jgi:anthranilate synthase component 1